MAFSTLADDFLRDCELIDSIKQDCISDGEILHRSNSDKQEDIILRSDFMESFPRVRHATFINEDTGQVTPLYLYSHDEIDAEIDQRIRFDQDQPPAVAVHEATRERFHSLLRSQTLPTSACSQNESQPLNPETDSLARKADKMAASG